jgi:hypothetical protein
MFFWYLKFWMAETRIDRLRSHFSCTNVLNGNSLTAKWFYYEQDIHTHTLSLSHTHKVTKQDIHTHYLFRYKPMMHMGSISRGGLRIELLSVASSRKIALTMI